MALYHFEEGVGDVLRDSSGRGHDGKILGARWSRIAGPSASAAAGPIPRVTLPLPGRWSALKRMPSHISSQTFDNWPDLSSDGRHLVFVRMHHVMLATRKTGTGPFEKPMVVHAGVQGGPGRATGPTITDDGLVLVFTAFESDTARDHDLYYRERSDLKSPFGPPVRLDGGINTPDMEGQSSLSEDGLQLLFRRSSLSAPGDHAWLVTTRRSRDEPFAPPTPIPWTAFPKLPYEKVDYRRNGLELVIRDKAIWRRATRLSTTTPFLLPEQLFDCGADWGDVLNPGVMGWTFSGDYSTAILGMGEWKSTIDLWEARREGVATAPR